MKKYLNQFEIVVYLEVKKPMHSGEILFKNKS